MTKVFTLEFIDSEPDPEGLVLVHRWGMQKGLADAFWHRMRALSAANLVKALLDDSVLKEIASHIRHSTSLRVDVAELRERLIADVLKEGLVGQVSLTDVGAVATPESSPTRRVRVSHLISAGLLQPGERLIADWNGDQVAVTVLASGALSFEDQEVRNLYEATRLATSGGSGASWDFWRSESGDSLEVLRDRFIQGS